LADQPGSNRLIGRGWPKLGAALGLSLPLRVPPEADLAEVSAALSSSYRPTDHRFPHVIARLNAVARATARKAGVAYIDLFWNTLDLLDLAFDASHYAAPVAQHHARCVLHWMRTVRGAPGEGGGAANDTSRRSTLAYGCFTEYD